jgi:putative membrane protein
MVVRNALVLISGVTSQLPPGDLVPGQDTTAQASGNAALVVAENALSSGNLGIANAATALASGNAGISTGLTALASGNAALVVGAEALASGNAALVDAATALSSGNAGISTGLTALASGNAGISTGLTALASGNAGISTGLTALASGNAALVNAATALASGNAGIAAAASASASASAANTVATAALASGNAALSSVGAKYDKTGGPISGPIVVQSQAFGTPSGVILGSGVITLDFGTRNNFEVVLTAGTSTLASPTSASGGQCGALVFRQDSVGTRLLTYSGAWSFIADTAPILTTSASGVDLLAYYVVNPNRINIVSSLNFGSGTVS